MIIIIIVCFLIKFNCQNVNQSPFYKCVNAAIANCLPAGVLQHRLKGNMEALGIG